MPSLQGGQALAQCIVLPCHLSAQRRHTGKEDAVLAPAAGLNLLDRLLKLIAERAANLLHASAL